MRSIDWVAETLDAPIHHRSRSTSVTGVSIDSRTIEPGQLFVALPGERADGHEFLDDAFQKGAGGALVQRLPSAAQADVVNCLQVKDPLRALQQLATRRRTELDIPIIGITGSAGKTTTKELIHAVLSRRYRTYCTPGNYNTEIGVPLSLFNMPDGTEVGIIEMGLQHPGDIRTLSGISRPTIGTLTSIGDAHIGFFPNQEALALEKWALMEALPHAGHAIFNLDAPYVAAWRRNLSCSTVSLALEHPDADATAVDVDDTHLVGLRLSVLTNGKTIPIQTSLLGRHNAYAVLAAVAVGCIMDVPTDETLKAVDAFKPLPHRMELKRSKRYGLILDDTYNASPTATRGALTTLARLEASHHKIAVLGDMRELGGQTETHHECLAELIHDLGIDRVFTVGDLACQITDALRTKWGWSPKRARHAADLDQLEERLSESVAENDALILVKGARAMALDHLVERLVTPTETPRP